MSIDAWSISSDGVSSPIVCAWADRPSASTLSESQLMFVSDVPNALIGSWWKPLPSFGVFAPLSGDLLLSVNTTSSATDGTTNEQILQQATLPAGSLQASYRVEIDTIYSKNSGVVAGTYRVRMGASGTTADAIIHTIAVTATTRSGRARTSVFFPSATTASVCPTANGATEQSLTVFPSTVAIPDFSSNNNIISVSFQLASAAVMNLENCQVKLLAL